MDDFWAQRTEQTKGKPNVLEILARNAPHPQPSKSVAPIQAKLAIGQPHDRYEQEADQVATQVVEQIQRPTPTATQAITAQRQEDQDNETLQTQPEIAPGQDVFFRQGAYDWRNPGKQGFMAPHESIHGVQQNGDFAQPTIQRREQDNKYMCPAANPKIDRNDPQVIEQLHQDALREEQEEERELATAQGKQAKASREDTKHKGDDNENYRGSLRGGMGSLLARAVYGVKAIVKNLPDVAVKRIVPAGPNANALIDPTDYGVCDTEDIGEAELKVTAVQQDSAWHAEVTQVIGPYSKIIQLPAGVHEVTGPGGGGPGETTLANSRRQIKCLLATFGPPYYMASAVDGHESVHETRVLPALRFVAPEIQRRFSLLTVPDTVGDKDAALAAIKALPAYAATLAGLRDLWDAKYVELIGDDHQGAAQKGEEKASRPMIDKINAFRVKNGKKAIPVKYTWTPY
ncbi:hypothetical protein [Leptolyngbya sp. PCC 6406]|uniref:hypothetical protein n=1 Tax=Leptolyngbya sp. PCC 6406 TaxID=1173264 RepID=UPI0012DD22A0|nr:hypothetical protein [Leptolyngbya sp. PCC 6406]